MEPLMTSTLGLEGVVAAETRLSHVDGEAGELIVAGARIEDLAGRVGYEALAGRMLGSPDLGETLGAAREAAWRLLCEDPAPLHMHHGMDALRAGLARLEAGPGEPGAALAALLIGAVPVWVAAWWRRAQGFEPLAPDPRRGHAEDALRMIRGEPPSPVHAAALDAYLVTTLDHGLNASTFAARVVASTGSDLVSAVVAAVGALKGPLHGGAPGPVLDMLDSVATEDRARPWLQAELARGRRIMGMGHRIYRVRDPRAAVLEEALLTLVGGRATPRLLLARAIEREALALLALAHPGRPLAANVEFYTALLLDALGLDRRLFTPLFAVARVAGWCAHALEQAASGRLIRPSSRYVGERPPEKA